MSSIIPRGLIKHLEWDPSKKSNPVVHTPQPSPPIIQPVSPISSTPEFWAISGVQYRGGVHDVLLAKSLLDGGSKKTQDNWARLYSPAKDKGEFYTPDYPIFYGLLKALYNAKDDTTKSTEIAEAQKFLKDTSRAKWLMTLTRIAYQPSDKDRVIHNFGTDDKYEEQVDFITPDEWIKDTSNPASYRALLGTEDNVQEINNVFQWLNGTNTYAWKVNSRPSSVDERVAGFYADSVRAFLSCDWGPSYTDSSLGVCLRKKI